jgi:hypothetical protein
MSTEPISFIIPQGDTFRLSLLFLDTTTGYPLSMTGKTITPIFDTLSGIRLEGIEVDTTNISTGIVILYAPPTVTLIWPDGPAMMTIEILDSNEIDITSSKSFSVIIVRR